MLAINVPFSQVSRLSQYAMALKRLRGAGAFLSTKETDTRRTKNNRGSELSKNKCATKSATVQGSLNKLITLIMSRLYLIRGRATNREFESRHPLHASDSSTCQVLWANGRVGCNSCPYLTLGKKVSAESVYSARTA